MLTKINEELIFLYLQDKLYGQGTDIRRVNKYLDEVKDMIAAKKNDWGDLTNKKIIFIFENGQIYIKAAIYLENFDSYVDLQIPKLLLP